MLDYENGRDKKRVSIVVDKITVDFEASQKLSNSPRGALCE